VKKPSWQHKQTIKTAFTTINSSVAALKATNKWLAKETDVNDSVLTDFEINIAKKDAKHINTDTGAPIAMAVRTCVERSSFIKPLSELFNLTDKPDFTAEDGIDREL
jgi:hypothetical protein